MLESPFLALSLGIGLVWFVRTIIARRKRNPRGLPLPPGPKALPLLGNMLQFPLSYPWEGYSKLCEQYGDIVYMKAPGQGVLILGSRRRAMDLLDKRAIHYSDRPDLPIIEMLKLGWSFGLMSYTGAWKEHRRAFHRFFNSRNLPTWHPIMYEERKALLRRFKSQPDVFFEHVQLFFGTLTMRVAYGFDDVRQNSVLIRDAEAFLAGFNDAATPGRFLVNSIPSLRYVPSWFPGAGFKKHLSDLAQVGLSAINVPFEQAKQSHENGRKGQHPSVAANYFDGFPEEGDENRLNSEDVARNVCGIIYVGGADTSTNAALALIYAIATHPDVQARAQAEIDSVVGRDRLPAMTDIEHLPYVLAIVKECGRWFTVVPLGIPHSNSLDDEYDGYFVPKGTIILQNNWVMMHDSTIFHKPFEFIPDRYLKDGKIDKSVPDSEMAAFGHGRRICPGREFANDALFLMTASLIATFTINASKDRDGNFVPLKLEPNLPTSKILPFQCEIRSRPGREHLFE